jgi:hypothetical protein
VVGIGSTANQGGVMAQYLLSIYQPDGPPPPEIDFEQMRKELDALNDDIRSAGAWVFTGGLFPADRATVVRQSGTHILTMDGPYVEGKEHLGGFTIVEAADLDAALGWAGRLTEITGLPVEVRPFQHA